MSPEYRVDIPPDNTTRFEEFVKNLGGEILKRPYSQEEVDQAWSQQVDEARILIDKFENPQDPNIEREINQGLRNLVNDAFSKVTYPTREQIRPIIDWQLLKRTMISLFKERTPKDKPENIWATIPYPKNKMTFSGGLLPRDIVFLVERYGLADGQPKTIKQIAEAHGMSSENTGNRIGRILKGMFYKDPLRSQVFEKVEVRPIRP